MTFSTVKDIRAWRLCVGCGACAYICPKKQIELVDVIDEGIRPIVKGINCGRCKDCVEVCPGYRTSHVLFDGSPGPIEELQKGWGPILEIWEGYASDAEVRYSGSSGGLASAIALYCLENKGWGGILHAGVNPRKPWENMTVFSRNRSDIISQTGSRYSPASPCDGLAQIESASGPCMFIGKGCDVAGLRKSQVLRAEVEKNKGVVLGIFCAGTPSTRGTIELFEKLNVEAEKIREVRYRGRGWPGRFTAHLNEEESPSYSLTYMESWGFLQKFRPFRCYLCPDGTSELADISCGDPWYREIKEGDAGFSLALVRTQRGREILHGAMDSGYVSLERVGPKILKDSQRNLLEKRKAIWGRLLAMKFFGIPTPRLVGFYLFQNWLKLPIPEKARSFLGTVRRIIQRKYYQPMKYNSTG